MCATKALTVAGIVARAPALAEYAPDFISRAEHPGCRDDVHFAALLRDLVAMGGRS